MELDCSKLGGSRRDGWGTIGGLGSLAPLATRLLPTTEMTASHGQAE